MLQRQKSPVGRIDLSTSEESRTATHAVFAWMDGRILLSYNHSKHVYILDDKAPYRELVDSLKIKNMKEPNDVCASETSYIVRQ